MIEEAPCTCISSNWNTGTKKEAAEGNHHQFSSSLFQKPIIKKSKSRERSSYHLAEIKKDLSHIRKCAKIIETPRPAGIFLKRDRD